MAEMRVRLREDSGADGHSAEGRALEKLRRKMEERWLELAISELHTSREEYLAGMSIALRGKRIVMTLGSGRRGRADFSLAVAREMGMPAFDLRKGFLASKKGIRPSRAGALPRASRRIPLDPGGQQIRTISATSRTDAWRHPGMEGRHLMERVVEEAQESMIPEILAEEIGGIL